jgi:hypothetical protein
MIGFYAVRDLMPLYAVYSLLFRDHGVSTGQVSTLLVIWSITAFVMEVPSGAWADAVSRRSLLILSSLLHAVGFALWMVVPSYAGFAAGFVCWGTSSALMSGTFEALLYDELAAHGATPSYARLMGWANSVSMVANLVGTVLAAPLPPRRRLVGWQCRCRVAAGLLAVCPGAPVSLMSGMSTTTGPDGVTASRPVRCCARLSRRCANAPPSRGADHGVVAQLHGAILLRARDAEKGAATQTVPILVGLTVAGQAVGTALAGRTARLSQRVIAGALGVAGGLIAVGMAEGRWLGFLAIGVGYGITANAVIVAEARLQDAISGPARATVTSVTGLLSESFSVMAYAALRGPHPAPDDHGIALTADVGRDAPPTLATRSTRVDNQREAVPTYDSGAEAGGDPRSRGSVRAAAGEDPAHNADDQGCRVLRVLTRVTTTSHAWLAPPSSQRFCSPRPGRPPRCAGDRLPRRAGRHTRPQDHQPVRAFA